MSTDIKSWVPELKRISAAAGEAILTVYRQLQTTQVHYKDDASPVTAADWEAHQCIQQGLQQLTPGVPQLSEEAAAIPWVERSQWSRFWLIDPLDGTKEFLAANDEFTVNIAWIDQGRPLLGVIYQPVTQTWWWGGQGLGAWKQQGSGDAVAIRTRSLALPQLEVLTSHRHGLEKLQAWLASMRQQRLDIQARPLGSSLKFCHLAEGLADAYPRLGPTGEWDTAAAHALLQAAGGDILTWQLEPLRYNQQIKPVNPNFIALADLQAPWREWLGVS